MSTVSDLRSLYRTLADDKVADYLLSDADFLAFLNEAQDEACLRSDLLLDKTSAFCTITVVVNTSSYTLNASIYGLAYVRLIDAGGVYTRLTSTTYDDLTRDDPSWREQTGPPTAYVQTNNTIELTPVPDAAATLKLEAYRLPARLTIDTSVPEINATLHNALLNWVLYRVYSSPDVDLSNPRKAAEFLGEFAQLFGFKPKAASHLDKYANRPHTNRPSLIY